MSTPLDTHLSGWGREVPQAKMVAGGIILIGFGAILVGVSPLLICTGVLSGGFICAHVLSLTTSK